MPAVEPIYAEVGARIRHYRTLIGMNQESLGDLLEPPMAKMTISQMETGRQRVMLHVLMQIADVLRVPITDLLP
jgi:transcriptional regulator with XRE-family HTH domain